MKEKERKREGGREGGMGRVKEKEREREGEREGERDVTFLLQKYDDFSVPFKTSPYIFFLFSPPWQCSCSFYF